MLSKYVTMVKGAVEELTSETVNDLCTLIWTCVSCPSYFRTCKIRYTCEIVNTLTLYINITALWDLTMFSLVHYIYMYVAEKLVASNSGKNKEGNRIFRNDCTCEQKSTTTQTCSLWCVRISPWNAWAISSNKTPCSKNKLNILTIWKENHSATSNCVGRAVA